MNKQLSANKAGNYLYIRSLKERRNHKNTKINFYSNVDGSSCYYDAIRKQTNIHIGLKDFYDDEQKYGYVTDKSFVKVFVQMYHELGHKNTYNNMFDKLSNDPDSLSKIEKEILLDTQLSGICPEYNTAIYFNSVDEKLAELNGINAILKEYQNKTNLFSKLGISADTIYLDYIKDYPAWYSQDKKSIKSLKSLSEAGNLLQSEISVHNQTVIAKNLLDIRGISLNAYEQKKYSVLDDITKKPELLSYLNAYKSKTDLSQRMLDCTITVRPDLISSELLSALPSNVRPPIVIQCKSDRMIKNMPDFTNTDEENHFDYD